MIPTPFSFVASANCILFVGATPVFVDIDPKTLNIDVTYIEVPGGNHTNVVEPNLAGMMQFFDTHKKSGATTP